MTDSEVHRHQPAGLVLAAVGPPGELTPRLQRAADRLVALTAWPLRSLEPAHSPAQALAALGEGRSTLAAPAWLAPLPLDPGLSLGRAGHWAEGLGAWRQPTVLLLDAAQLDTGWPAAATALLKGAGVPLVGLIQWGGTWEPERRREEALPWLGVLAEPDGAGEGGAVLLALMRRWRALDLT
jgi:hypothetical protein